MEEAKNYLVRCDDPTAAFLMPEIRRITGTEPRQSDIKGIGGGAEVIIFGTAVLGAITALLDLITKAIVAGRTIKGIKIGDAELKDPQESDIAELRKQIGESSEGGEKVSGPDSARG